MITYKEAKKMALEYEPGVDTCYEYPNAYRFVARKQDSDGVGDIVVMKDGSGVLGFMQFIDRYNPAPELKEIEF